MRDKCVHIRFSRGSEYSSCASSTARRASWVRASGEYVENHFGAIEHLDAQLALEIADLRGGQIVVEDHDVGVGGSDHQLELFELAFAEIGRHIGRLAALG